MDREIQTKLKMLFRQQIKYSKEIQKEDIHAFLLDRGIECRATLAKEKMLDLIIDKGFEDDFTREFMEFVRVPSWEVAEHYGLKRQDIDMLYDIGVITEAPKVESFYSRTNKCEVDFRAYPFAILLNYTTEQLNEAYEKAYPKESYALRIETKTEEESTRITERLQNVFVMTKSPQIYEHRAGNGFYTYYHVQIANNSDEQENRFLKEIADLKRQVKEKDEQIRELQQSINRSLRQSISDNEFEKGVAKGIQEERKRRNAGRKKNPNLENEYISTGKEIHRLLDMGHSMKEVIENGMITKVNPKTKQIEPISKSTIYRCMRAYKNSK